MQPIDISKIIILKRELITANIYYYLPDFPSLLQVFVWQDFDTPPEYPKLHQFMTYWATNIEGKVHEVEVVATEEHRHIFTPWDIENA